MIKGLDVHKAGVWIITASHLIVVQYKRYEVCTKFLVLMYGYSFSLFSFFLWLSWTIG